MDSQPVRAPHSGRRRSWRRRHAPGGGQYEDDTLVQSVIRAIDRIHVPIETQGLADGTDSERFVAGVLIGSYWPDVQGELNLIFTADTSFSKPTGSGGTDVDESVSKLDDLREDLSDIAEFQNTFSTEIAGLSGVTADQIYEAKKRVVALDASTNTRLGVIATQGPDITAQVAAGGTAPTTTPFALSPLAATQADALPSHGTARYSGRTWAIDGSEVLYSGSIELLASIAIEQVTATISNLRKSDDSASWKHNGKAVREITLPAINRNEFDDNGSLARTGADARVVYDEFGGLSFVDVGHLL